MIKTIEEAAKELASQWLPGLGQPVLGWPENADKVSDEFRLSIRRQLETEALKSKLLDLANKGALKVRASGGWYLPDASEVSESSLVEISEARLALEAAGTRFVQIETADQTPVSIGSSSEEIRKKDALIDEVIDFWPTIENDMSDAGRNGLRSAAKHPDHGYWRVEPAINWANQRGKIVKNKARSFLASNDESSLSPMLRLLLKID